MTILTKGCSHRRADSPANGERAKMKPIPSQVRRVPPFGSPKGGRVARPDETKRGRRRVVQVDSSHGDTDARVPRRGRWWGSVAAPASRVHGRPGIGGHHPAADRVSRGRLNGFPESRAGVLRHRTAGKRRRRVLDTSPTGVSDATKVGQPAYPRYNRGLARDVAPSIPNKPRAPVGLRGRGVAPLPPVTAQPGG